MGLSEDDVLQMLNDGDRQVPGVELVDLPPDDDDIRFRPAQQPAQRDEGPLPVDLKRQSGLVAVSIRNVDIPVSSLLKLTVTFVVAGVLAALIPIGLLVSGAVLILMAVGSFEIAPQAIPTVRVLAIMGMLVTGSLIVWSVARFLAMMPERELPRSPARR